MKALTLYQPWASMVAMGAKRIETRSWNTKYRGPLAIHASKNKTFRFALASQVAKALPEAQRYYHFIKDLPFGCVIATCNLIHVTRVPSDAWVNNLTEIGINQYSWKITEQELAFGDYSAGRYLWLLDNVRLLPVPYPARGAIGLWEWTP